MPTNIYYVYCHRKGDKIVYIGKGKDGRAWCSNRSLQCHSDWIKMCHSTGDFSYVEIIIGGLGEKAALMYEKELIQLHKPIFNQTNNTINNKRTKKRVLKPRGTTT